MNTYTTEAARVHLGDIVTQAAAGIPSLITYHGVPAALVVPVAQEPHPIVRDSDSGTATESHGR